MGVTFRNSSDFHLVRSFLPLLLLLFSFFFPPHRSRVFVPQTEISPARNENRRNFYWPLEVPFDHGHVGFYLSGKLEDYNGKSKYENPSYYIDHSVFIPVTGRAERYLQLLSREVRKVTSYPEAKWWEEIIMLTSSVNIARLMIAQ